MTPGSILLGAALLILTAIFVARPLLRPPSAEQRRSERLAQLAAKDALLEEIRQLEFDHDTGKVPTDLFAVQREKLVLEAARILQSLAAESERPADSVDEAIEQAVAALRDAPPAASARLQGAANFCSQCGQSVVAGDNFCTYCGYQLQRRTAASTS